jgi:hypothetical protein
MGIYIQDQVSIFKVMLMNFVLDITIRVIVMCLI